jgi:putative oxidoreductase
MTARRLLVSAGRLLLSGIFLKGGYDALTEPGGRPDQAAALDLPGDPEFLVRLNGAAMMAGGAALAVGVLPRVAAGGLIASLVPTTLAGHRFWKIDDPKQKRMQLTQFLKNLGLIGGLVLVLGAEGRDA